MCFPLGTHSSSRSHGDGVPPWSPMMNRATFVCACPCSCLFAEGRRFQIPLRLGETEKRPRNYYTDTKTERRDGAEIASFETRSLASSDSGNPYNLSSGVSIRTGSDSVCRSMHRRPVDGIVC